MEVLTDIFLNIHDKREEKRIERAAEMLLREVSQKPGYVTLWRALIGSEGKSQYNGVSNIDLQNLGVFTSNYSLVQRSGPLEDESFYLDEDTVGPNLLTQVKGLPVFMDVERALGYLTDKRFRSPPALVCLQIPIDQIGEGKAMRLFQNNPGREVTYEDLEQITSRNAEVIHTECYLQGPEGEKIGDEVRQHERIFVPKLTIGKHVRFGRPFQEASKKTP